MHPVMQDHAIVTAAQSGVGVFFKKRGRLDPATPSGRAGEGLGTDDRATAGPGGASYCGVDAGVAVSPELAHGQVGKRRTFHRVERAAISFMLQLHARLVNQLRRRLPAVFVVERGYDIPIIPLEPSGLLCAADEASRRIFAAVLHRCPQRHEPRQRVVALALLKLSAEIWRPVLVARLVAINQEVTETPSKERTEMFLQRINDGFPVKLRLRETHLVNFERLADDIVRHRMRRTARRRMTQSINNPVPSRGVPVQLAGSRHILGEIQHFTHGKVG